MTAFFDIRQLFRIDKNGKIKIGLWTIAVVFLTLAMFFLKFLDIEFPIYVICTVASLVLFIGEMLFVFRHSGHRITPLLIFLSAFYFVRNSQYLLILFGVPFDAHPLILLQPNLKDAIVMTSIGNIWAGFSGVLLTASEDTAPQNTEDFSEPVSAKLFWRILHLSGLFCAVIAYGFGFFRMVKATDWIPEFLLFFEDLFVPIAFFAILFLDGQRKYEVTGLLAGYFLVASFGDRQSAGYAGLFLIFLLLARTVCKDNRKKSLILFGVSALVTALLSAGSFFLLSDDLEGLVFGEKIGMWLADIGRDSVTLLKTVSIVPDSEPQLFGNGYVAEFLAGLLPNGVLPNLTSKINLLTVWNETYFSSLSDTTAFSWDAEGFLNFGWLGFLGVFVGSLLVGMLLDRERRIGENRYTKFVTVTMLWVVLSMTGNSSSHIWRIFLWGILPVTVFLAVYAKKRKNIPKEE